MTLHRLTPRGHLTQVAGPPLRRGAPAVRGTGSPIVSGDLRTPTRRSGPSARAAFAGTVVGMNTNRIRRAAKALARTERYIRGRQNL